LISPILVRTTANKTDIITAKVSGLNLSGGMYWAGFYADVLGLPGFTGGNGISDFNALHSGKHNEEVQLYAFDVLALNGDDLRSLPLLMRKAHLSRLSKRANVRLWK
jgi:hypothetical protein